MPLDKPIEQIVEADLRGLIENKVCERKTIEYKQLLPGKSDAERKEFFADISSFANASGGRLVYGMREEEGAPVELTGLDVGDADAAVSAHDNAIRDGIKPRIPGVVVWAVPLANGRKAMVIRVPRSFVSPHMVTFGGTSRFYARNSNGKYQLDVEEIRAAFLMSESVLNRVRDFRLERVARIEANETPVPLPSSPRLVLHAVPLAALSGSVGLDPRSVSAQDPNKVPLFPLGYHGWRAQRFNFEGLVRYTGPDEAQGLNAYVQVFRNGILEGVNTSLLEAYAGEHFISGFAFEEAVIESVGDFASSLSTLGLDVPVALMLTLLRIKGYKMAFSGHVTIHGGVGFDRDTLILAAIMLEQYDADFAALTKEWFDMVWNADGWAGSRYYDEQGRRKRA